MQIETIQHMGVEGRMVIRPDNIIGELTDSVEPVFFSGKTKSEALTNFQKSVEKYLTEF